MDRYFKQFDNCLQKELPYCGSDCPFRMNVNDFLRGNPISEFEVFE